jgi:hypothetical protein
MAVANNPFQREVWRQTNPDPDVYYSVFLCTKSQFTAESGVTVDQKVAAALSFGAVDRTNETAPGNVYFLEGLREVAPS